MPKSQRDYKYRNVVSSVLNEVWLIRPEKLSQITRYLEMRAAGEFIDEDAIRAEFGFSDQPDDKGTDVVDGVKVIDVMGTLTPRMNLMNAVSGGTSTMMLAKTIEAAASDDSIKSIVLSIDSPGGAASFIPEATQSIKDAASVKRVVSVGVNQMASGAFWLGSGATESYASQSTLVGSVGAMAVTASMKEKHEARGEKYEVIRAGNVKGAGNEYEELTEDFRATLQAQVSSIYAKFTESLSENLGVSLQQIEDKFGQGTVFLADEAVHRGMILGVKTFEEVLAIERDRVSAAVSVAVGGGAIVNQENGMTITTKTKAALFGLEYIQKADASDETCEAAIRAVAKARGVSLKEDVGEKEIIDLLTGKGAEPAVAELTSLPPATSSEETILAARKEGEQHERARVSELLSRAELIGVEASDVKEAIEDKTMTVDKATKLWLEKSSSAERPLGRGIVPGTSQSDKMIDEIADTVMATYGSQEVSRLANERIASAGGGSFTGKRFIEMARAYMQHAGMRVTGSNEMDALSFLQAGGTELRIMADGGTANSPGAHPDLLSALANKMMMRGPLVAPVKFSQWAAKMDDLPDLKPKAIVDTGVFAELDHADDDEVTKELKFDSELTSWMQAEMYKNKVGLTVAMTLNDELGGFTRQLTTMGGAPDRTLNRMCLDLLAGNVTLIDGTALFHADHSNVVASGSGAAPSDTQASTMRKLHRLQTNMSDITIDIPPTRSLHPAAQEQTARQVFHVGIVDPKVAATDATINTVAGEISPIVDGRLDSYSTTMWYTFVNPELIPSIGYAYLRGYGAGGQRTTWFDNDRGTRYVKLEIGLAAAAISHRGVCRNYGA